MRSIVSTLGAALLIAVSARLDFAIPGSPVPQSAQTLAVLVVGACLGARLGTLALVAYLAAGAMGAPVFADGSGGWEHVVGPTAGYLVGFVAAAGVLGWLADRGWLERVVPLLLAMLGAHLIILTMGWLRLSGTIGFGGAFAQGVQPFLLGGVVKSLLAALVITLYYQWKPRSQIARQATDNVPV